MHTLPHPHTHNIISDTSTLVPHWFRTGSALVPHLLPADGALPAWRGPEGKLFARTAPAARPQEKREEERRKDAEMQAIAKLRHQQEQAFLEQKRREQVEAARAAAQREFDRNVRLEQLKAQTAAILAEQARRRTAPPRCCIAALLRGVAPPCCCSAALCCAAPTRGCDAAPVAQRAAAERVAARRRRAARTPCAHGWRLRSNGESGRGELLVVAPGRDWGLTGSPTLCGCA